MVGILSVVAVIIVLLPFHAFLTVWGSLLIGHYTLLRLWKEFLVLFISMAAIWLVIVDRSIRRVIFKNKLTWAILAYALVDLIVSFWSYRGHQVSGKALAYGLLDDLRFLAFLLVVWAAALHSPKLNKRWHKLILWPAVVVIGFGLLQMSVLPANFLTHFGYGAKTIPPFETINNNPNYVRILSTLRGADPLGAYLILPISALVVMLVRFRKSWSWAKVLLLIGAIIVLYGSYSRGAWIGAVISCLFITATLLKREMLRRYKLPIIVALVVVVLIAGIGGVVLSHSARFQNIIFHTQTNSASPISSDQAHLSALESGLQQVADHPLGRGPGTAGPASVYNHDAPASIPEDYFLEIGEESGWLGLVLFIAINLLVGYELWQRRSSAFALTLLAALIGITFVNLITLSWTDDTLSYLWWGLAGLALSLPIPEGTKPKNKAGLIRG